MGIQNNSETLLMPVYGHIRLSITQDSSGIAPTITNQTGGTIARSMVTLTRASAGSYSLAISDFKGPRGVGAVVATISSTAAGLIGAPAVTFSSNTMTATVLTFNSSAVATDFTCNVDIMSY